MPTVTTASQVLSGLTEFAKRSSDEPNIKKALAHIPTIINMHGLKNIHTEQFLFKNTGLDEAQQNTLTKSASRWFTSPSEFQLIDKEQIAPVTPLDANEIINEVYNYSLTRQGIVASLTMRRQKLSQKPTLKNADNELTLLTQTYEYIVTSDEDLNDDLERDISTEIHDFPIDSRSELLDEKPDADDPTGVEMYNTVKNSPYNWFYEGGAGSVNAEDVIEIINNIIDDIQGDSEDIA